MNSFNLIVIPFINVIQYAIINNLFFLFVIFCNISKCYIIQSIKKCLDYSASKFFLNKIK